MYKCLTVVAFHILCMFANGTCICTFLTYINMASFLWDIGKQDSLGCDAAKCGVPSGAILFAFMNFIEN